MRHGLRFVNSNPGLLCLAHSNGARNGRAHHGVVAHADEAHHLNVRRHGGGACKLGVAVHPAHGVGHAIGSGAGRHVVRVQRAARAAARGNGKILLAVFNAPLFVSARNGMLETRWVRGIAGDALRIAASTFSTIFVLSMLQRQLASVS